MQQSVPTKVRRSTFCNVILLKLVGGTLLIAFATTSMQLRTVRALIDWGQLKVDKAPPQALPLNPTVRSKHLAGTSWVPDGPTDPMNVSHSESSMVQLSHLELLPPTADNNGSPVPATVVAIRSSLPSLTSHYNQDVHSTIDRWEIQEPNPRAHPAFEQLSSRRNSTGIAPPVSSTHDIRNACLTSCSRSHI